MVRHICKMNNSQLEFDSLRKGEQTGMFPSERVTGKGIHV